MPPVSITKTQNSRCDTNKIKRYLETQDNTLMYTAYMMDAAEVALLSNASMFLPRGNSVVALTHTI